MVHCFMLTHGHTNGWSKRLYTDAKTHLTSTMRVHQTTSSSLIVSFFFTQIPWFPLFKNNLGQTDGQTDSRTDGRTLSYLKRQKVKNGFAQNRIREKKSIKEKKGFVVIGGCASANLSWHDGRLPWYYFHILNPFAPSVVQRLLFNLYKRCPSVLPFFCPSFRPSVRMSVRSLSFEINSDLSPIEQSTLRLCTNPLYGTHLFANLGSW